jgi:predicted DNA-binding transcriptional regulator AlpA
MHEAPTSPNGFDPLWDRTRICDHLAISTATFERWLAAKKFPPPISLGTTVPSKGKRKGRITPTCRRWRQSIVAAWVKDQETAAAVLSNAPSSDVG